MKTPNIIFVHSDQMHRDAIAAYGNRYAETPNLDRLVNEGHSFMKGVSS